MVYFLVAGGGISTVCIHGSHGTLEGITPNYAVYVGGGYSGLDDGV